MSRPFWFTSFASGGFTAFAAHSWADNEVKAIMMVSVLLGTIFALAIIDTIRTTPRPPTPRNP